MVGVGLGDGVAVEVAIGSGVVVAVGLEGIGVKVAVGVGVGVSGSWATAEVGAKVGWGGWVVQLARANQPKRNQREIKRFILTNKLFCHFDEPCPE